MVTLSIGEIIKPEESGEYGLGLPAEPYSENKVRYLRISDIDDAGCILDDDMKSVTAENIQEYLLKENDLVVARTGNSTGRTYMYESEDGKMAYAGFLIKYVFDEEKISPRYMKYFCLSDYYKTQIKSFVGSTRGNMSAGDFKTIQVIAPERVQQDRVANLFDLIDRKIKINKRINDNLSQTTSAIYDYWFMQFNFPDIHRKPYSLSGGVMIDSPALGCKIPKGWNVVSLGDIAKICSESITPQAGIMYKHYSIPAFDESKLPKYEDGSAIDSSKYLVPEKAILVSKLNPQFKRIWMIYDTDQSSICSTEFIPFCTKNGVTLEYLYGILNSAAFHKYMVQCSSSSTGSRKRMPPELCLTYKVILPPDEVMKLFSKAVRSLHINEDRSINESKDLVDLRNYLLPLLMSGQATIDD